MPELSPENTTQLRTPIRNRNAIRPFGLFVHDYCSHEMYFADIDGVTYKKSKRLLRIWESKYPGEDLSNGQKSILPILNGAIGLVVQLGALAEGSGVFVLYGDPPYEKGAIVWSFSWPSNQPGRPLSQKELIELVDGADLAFQAQPEAT